VRNLVFLIILLCIVWSVTGRALPVRLAILALAVAIDRGSSFVQYTYAYTILLICGHYLYATRHTLMSSAHPRDPLHGITLETILTELVEQYGWAEMGRRVPIRCFLHDPSVKSSLTFLRKTPWARERVEGWYLAYKDS
jgi:DNA-binding protein VF530